MADIDPDVTFNRTLGDRVKDDLDYLKKDTGRAYIIRGQSLGATLYLVTNEKRDFKKYATSWEHLHSKLVYGINSLDPLVDVNILVVGHVGEFTDDEIFILPKDYSGSWRNLGEMLSKGVSVYADKYHPQLYVGRGYQRLGIPQTSFRLVTDIEGRVVMVHSTRDTDGIEPHWFGLLDLITIPKLVMVSATVGIASATGVSRLVRSIAGRVAARLTARGRHANWARWLPNKSRGAPDV